MTTAVLIVTRYNTPKALRKKFQSRKPHDNIMTALQSSAFYGPIFHSFGHVWAKGLFHPSAEIEKKSRKRLSYVVNFRLFQNVEGGWLKLFGLQYWNLIKVVENQVIKDQTLQGCHYVIIGFRALKLLSGHIESLYFIATNTRDVGKITQRMLISTYYLDWVVHFIGKWTL